MDDALERGGNEILLAIGPNPDEPPLEQLLPAVVAGVPLDTLLRKVMTIGASLANAEDRGIADADFWRNIAESIYDGETPRDFDDLLKTGGRLTNTTHLANLALYAVYVRNYRGLTRAVSFLRVLGLYNFAELRDPNTDKFYIDPDSVQAAFAVTTSHRERFLNVVHRYLSFVEWSDAHNEVGEVKVLLEASAGMSYRDYLLCIDTLQRFFDPEDVVTNGVRPLPRAAVRPDVPLLRWLDDHSYGPTEIDELLGSDPLPALRNRGHFWVIDRPFLKVDDHYYLLNPRALDNTLGLGVFFAAMNARTARAGDDRKAQRKAAQEFGGVAGSFYEEYAGELVRRIAIQSGSLFHGEVKDAAGNKSSDFFKLEDDALIIFEMHHARANRQVIESLEPEAIEATFQRVLYPKIKQLDCTIRKFAERQYVIPGVNRQRVRRIYPLVCLPSAFPRNAEIQKKIDAYIEATKWLPNEVAGILIAPLEIIEIESLEGLSALPQPIMFRDLIDEKTSEPRTRPVFFKNFLVSVKKMALQMSADEQHTRASNLSRLRDETAGWIVQ